MNKYLNMFCICALICAQGICGVACNEAEQYKPNVPDSPYEVRDIKVQSGIIDDEFCHYIDLENIHKTIPMVNRYINNLPASLDKVEVAQALVAFFKSFPGITDARLSSSEYMKQPAVFFSFLDAETDRELTLDFSSTGKVLSYHYNVVRGAYVKTKRYVTIDRVFDLINSLDFEVREVMYGTYISSRMSSETELQRILDALNAKAYTNDGNVWWTTGYLHYKTGQITIFPHLVDMHNRNYQADWLASMREYSLSEKFDYDGSGYAVEFLIPEDATVPEQHWKDIIYKYDIVELADMNYNRYTLSDETIGGGYEDGVTAIDSKIHISPMETYQNSPRSIQLYCATERQYGSGSNPIIVAKEQSDGTIDISFKGVAEIGMTADIGPARACIDLGALAEGTYIVNLHNGDVKQPATIIVTADSYTFEMTDNPTFVFSHNKLNRIPEDTIWGDISYMSDMTPAIADEFLADMAALGAETGTLAPGYYREFEIDKDGKAVQPEPDNPNHPRRSRYFAFHYSDDTAKVEQLIRRYLLESEKYNLYISVYTDKGEQFLSWMYDR